MVKRRIDQSRLYIFLAGVFLLFGLISWRLYDIAWRRHEWYAQTSQAQASGSSGVLLRGNIYLTDGTGQDFLAATNRKFPALALAPTRLDQGTVDQTVERLVQITGADAQTIGRVAKGGASGSRVVLHRLKDDQVAAIKQLGIPGVSITYETDRSYPAGMLGAHVLGFLGYGQSGRQGQYGIEGYYDQELSGHADTAAAHQWDILGQLKGFIGKADAARADHTEDRPKDVVLTIDRNIQSFVEEELDKVLKRYSAASGTVIVQEPRTGRILAMTGSPSFDPNSYSSYPVGSFMNTAVQTPFEPGSSFKPFTMAVGLDLGKIRPDTTFDDVNDIVVDGYTIKNFNGQHFGRVTMSQVLEKSINAGTMYVESLLTNDQFLNAVINDGFGQKTGIDLPGEASGDIGNLYTGRPINFMTASFGQGITVTPIQLVNAYSAIANGGKLMKPYVVASVRDDQGHEQKTQPEVVGTPFSAKTAATLRTMLTSVVDNGFDKARIPRYDVAGKTGTAQIADSVKGGYLEAQYNHTFLGFAPASDPRFVILIKMEKPHGITYAADSLSPVFKNIALFLLNYMNVPPTR
jgi:cell division protein FtsI/penicillin-binding protein 2